MAEEDIIAPPTLRVVTPKPRMTIYYALLIIALVAMVTACVFLYMVIRTFGGFGVVPGRVSSVDRPVILFYHKGHKGHEEVGLQIRSVPSVLSVVRS
jgi:hypothetical protein